VVGRALRICVVGDELVAGAGDSKGLGWVGRVIARTQSEIPPIVMTLAVPGETTTALGLRWDQETARRFSPEADNRLVVALGRADQRAGISPARSRLNLANILDVAEARHLPTFVVGPPPAGARDAEALAELSRAYRDVAIRRGITYVDTFAPLEQHDQWLADLASSSTGLPGQAGYGLMAWLVLHSGWHTWLELPADEA
jgi:acyl-CoA thioesterase-1